MPDQSSSIQFEDVPLDEARRMGRGSRMEPMLYDTLRQKIQSLSIEATRIHLGPEITPNLMKNYLLRIARDLNIPITIRRVPGGLLFWRSREEDLQQAQEAAGRLQTAQRRPQARPRPPPPGVRCCDTTVTSPASTRPWRAGVTAAVVHPTTRFITGGSPPSAWAASRAP